ncbi:hypothetical protein N7481_008790 [Penicillium waksmanii]|uniref:uncharacterized protein n=1 Tax=Penicillium waksmanii TaxID=69791 RepID=UPI0025466D49|nr:uncharacterized protein N7481_008790 [Penicillium waksmanii]KAJ5975083.1 hypothetical protein N7481_008790 [Penicillium waksmanii]
MSDSNQNESDQDLEGLPPSVRRYIYEGQDHFSRIVAVERERLLNSMQKSREHNEFNTASDDISNTEPATCEVTEFLIFNIDPFTFRRDFLEHNPILTFSIRLSFNPKMHTLIIKMVTAEHTQVGAIFRKAVDGVLEPMGLDNALNYVYEAVDIDVNGRRKQADLGWGPRRPPPGCPKRPTVVVEVGVSETQSKLCRDVNLWLDPTRGMVGVAIAIKINCKKPMITIDKWTWDPATRNAVQTQHIEVSEDQTDKVELSGGPLIIPFRHLFLRDPQTPREKDVIIDREWLIDIAERGWEMQFQ